MNRHVLVTGATGRLGRAMLPALREHGMRVYGLARRAAQQLAPPLAVPISCDITDADAVRQALGHIAVDSVVHLADRGRTTSAIEPDAVLRTNVVGTHNLLDWAADAGTSRFVMASAPERPTQPQSIYAISKCIAEQCCAFIAETTSMDACVVRFGSLSDSTERAEAVDSILAALEHTPQRPFEVFDIATDRAATAGAWTDGSVLA